MNIPSSSVSGAAASVIASGVAASSSDPSSSLSNKEANQSTSSGDAVNISSAAQEAQSASLSSQTYPYVGASATELQAINARVQAELSLANSPEGLAINAAQLPVPATPDSLEPVIDFAPGDYKLVVLRELFGDKKIGAFEWDQVKRSAVPVQVQETSVTGIAIQSTHLRIPSSTCAAR
jgi:hypothetical protein